VKVEGDALPIRWTCYSHNCHENYKQSILGLVRAVLDSEASKKVSLFEAELYLRRFLGCRPTCGNRRPLSRPQHEKILPFWPREQVRKQLQIPSPYFLKRGFSPDILDRMDVGHSQKQDNSIVPLHEDDGKLCIGYMARSEWPECEKCRRYHRSSGECRHGSPKWSVSSGFPKASYLYNYGTAVRSESRIILLVEGPGDVWKAEEAGFLAVALLGVEAFAEQARKLVALKKVVLLCLDNDKCGREARIRVERRLSKHGVLRENLHLPPSYKDLGDVPVEKLRKWLFDTIAPSWR
jgi:hypothetical protein